MSKTELRPEPDFIPAIANSNVEAHFKQLEGRILTLLDAVLSEPQQNKAAKDIVRGHFRDKIHDVYTDSIMYTGTKRNPASAQYAVSPN